MGEQSRRTVEHGADPTAGGGHRAAGGLSDARDAQTDEHRPGAEPGPRPDMDGSEPGALGPIADERETERLAPASSEDGASLPADGDAN